MSKKRQFKATRSGRHTDFEQNAELSQWSYGQFFCCRSVHVFISEREIESLRRPCFKHVGARYHYCSFDRGVSGLRINVSISCQCISTLSRVYTDKHSNSNIMEMISCLG